MATCLLSNILSDLRQQGVALVEAQTMQNNEPALELYRRLGFFEVDRGSVYRKDAPA
jgi:ribosomal protein S18 acetylase RimI-like enzyme